MPVNATFQPIVASNDRQCDHSSIFSRDFEHEYFNTNPQWEHFPEDPQFNGSENPSCSPPTMETVPTALCINVTHANGNEKQVEEPWVLETLAQEQHLYFQDILSTKEQVLSENIHSDIDLKKVHQLLTTPDKRDLLTDSETKAC